MAVQPQHWRYAFSVIGFALLLLLNFEVSAQETQSDGPNIILILADDLGYGDLGCYGQESIRTPNIDRMARAGLRFTNHYAGSTVCAPSRCCLLTGKHTGHVAIRGNSEVLLPSEETTVAELLKGKGYKTAAFGKWGVGHPPPPGDPERNGFEQFFGYLDMWHAHNYYPDFLWDGESKMSIMGNLVEVIGRGGVAFKRSVYSHDLFADRAVEFIKANKDERFFLYLPFTIPHANNEAREKGMEVPDAAPYKDTDWPEPQKNHAAMITRLDQTVGRILDLLTTLKITNNTLVLFTSDNGPHKEGGANPEFFRSSGPLRGYKRDLYEGGIRVPLIAWWPGTIKPATETDHISASWDFFPTFAELATAKVPAKLDGVSFAPTLLGKESQQQHEYLYWEFHERGTSQAVRFGKWKAVRFHQGKFELYDLSTDLTEAKDVSAENPDVLKKAKAMLDGAHTPSKLYPFKARKR
ncbi:MAG: N-acetylgalactosamine-6-sulfatase [Planctomycetaceae bacterium]|nr:N-acetylgalactosamine-6-sulfatase [Planctomycetaceae bacterium]